MEIPTIPKVVLDNLLASMGSRPASFKEGAPLMKENNGFRQLPVSLFQGASLRPPATAIPSRLPTLPPLPGGAHMRDLATSSPHLFNESADSFAREGSVLPVVKEKPKRVRKSRAGASSNKRGTSDTVLDMNLEGAQQTQLPPPKRRRPSAKLPNGGESVEKPPPRKRNRSKVKAKEEQSLSFSTNETSLSHSDPMSSKGILGMYGLEHKTLDLSRYMKDISVESLMAGDFSMPSFSGKQGPPLNHIMDNSFGPQVSSILQNLTRPVNTDQARAGSLCSQPTQRKPLKFSLDLESSPIDGSEERAGLYEPKIKALHKELTTPFLQSRKAPEPPSLFNPETIPVTPPADFWNTLQIQSNVSLSSLIAQASTTTDGRFFPAEAGSIGDKFSMRPPSIFSYGSSQILPESSGDRLASSKLNQWHRAEPPKWESTEIQPQHCVAFPRGSMFPFKLDIENDPPLKPSERCGLKDGFFDIDLNKQSPEAEAAESVAHSTSLNMSKPQVPNEVPVIVQVEVNMCDTDKEPQSVHRSECVNAPAPVNGVDGICNIKSLPVHQDLDHVLETRVASQHEDVKAERSSEELVSAIVDKQHGTEAVKDVPMNASSSLPTLFVPEVPETQEMCTDVPYSPGMHATAHILCKMANSSSHFYLERDDRHVQVMECDNDAYNQHPTKAAKVAGLDDKEAQTHKHTALHESWNEKYMVKVHSKDGKDKLFNHMGSSNGPNTEPWASTPPRHAPKNVASRMSGSQSSESDRSPCHGLKEHSSLKDLSNTSKVRRDYLEVAASSKVSSVFARKDPKGNPKPAPKTTFLHTLPTKGLLVSSQKKTKPLSLAAYGDRLTKVSRPRSNISKNCLQSQRSTNSYPVQSGCSLKSPTSRHVLPYVGEVRHGSK